jgi:hypothetical protein
LRAGPLPQLVVDDEDAPESYEINYITFYPYNGQYRRVGVPAEGLPTKAP